MREATIRIEAGTRYDALDLARNLPLCSWFLIARGADQWEVCVRADARRQRLIHQIVDVTEQWTARRHIASVVHLPGRDITFSAIVS